MADNVTLPGTGEVVATDDAGAGGHIQIIKLAISADGSVTVIPADATNGLDVDVTRVIPGTTATALGKAEDAAHADGDTGVLILGVRNHGGTGADGDYSAMSVTATGELRVFAHRDLLRIAVGVTGVTTSVTAYGAGDQVGTQISLANAARASGGTGVIVGVELVDQSDIIGAYDVVFTRASITPAADNAAFSISDANALEVVGIAQLAGSFDIGNNRIAQAYNLSIPYDCSGGTTLYANLITRVGHTFFTAGALPQLNVFVERN
jgi:hypothetical protein